MNSKALILSLFTLAAAGCVTAKPIVGPDGTQNQLITCLDIEKCYEKARQVCKGTYKIVNTTSQTSGAGGITDTDIKLLVKCDKLN